MASSRDRLISREELTSPRGPMIIECVVLRLLLPPRRRYHRHEWRHSGDASDWTINYVTHLRHSRYHPLSNCIASSVDCRLMSLIDEHTIFFWVRCVSGLRSDFSAVYRYPDLLTYLVSYLLTVSNTSASLYYRETEKHNDWWRFDQSDKNMLMPNFLF